MDFRSHSLFPAILLVLLLPLAPHALAGEEPVVWTGVTNVIVDGNSLYEDCSGCGNSGASSQQEISSGDGYMEFIAGASGVMYAAGLGTASQDNTLSEIEFSITLSSAGYAEVRHNGTWMADIAFVAGDRFRIAVEDGDVNYYKYNQGLPVFFYGSESPTTLQYPLRADTALLASGSAVLDVVISGNGLGGSGGNVTWTNLQNATASGSTLIETGGLGAPAGGESVNSIASGDGYVEFTAEEGTTVRGAGLGIGNATYSYAGIEYGMVLWGNGIAEIRESGTYMGEVPYSPGDRFRIAIENGTVKYYKYVYGIPQLFDANSSPTLSYPIILDAALYSANSTIADIQGFS